MDKDMKKRGFMIAIIAAVVIAGIGICIFLIFRHQKNKASQPQLQSQTNTASQGAPETTNAANHAHNYTTEIVPATCENPGYTLYSCTCGEAFQMDDIPANGHSYGAWEVVLDASAEAEGEKERVCTVCSSKITETIPKMEAPAHKHAYTATIVNATCITGGYTRHLCACGAHYDDNFISARSHSYGSFETIVWPTQTSTGVRQAICEYCGHCLTETLPKLGKDDAELYEKYVDTCIEIRHNPDGAINYSYNTVSVTDIRDWGEPPSVRLLNTTGLRITYQKQDGSSVEVMLEPIEGYARWMVIQKDGSYTLSLFGDFDD